MTAVSESGHGIDTSLRLEEPGVFGFTPRQPALPRVFGGEVIAKALYAASRSIEPGRAVHSMHAYFLRPGDPNEDLFLHVDPVHDGGSFAVRRVAVRQRGRDIVSLSASFHRSEEGLSFQNLQPRSSSPEQARSVAEVLHGADPAVATWFADLARCMPFEFRFVDEPSWVTASRGRPGPATQSFWIRAREALSGESVLHACAAAWASDLFLLIIAANRHGLVVGSEGVVTASLDHSIWFHAAFDAHDWLRYEQDCAWTGAARALCHGRLYNREGALVASVAQEGLVRSRR